MVRFSHFFQSVKYSWYQLTEFQEQTHTKTTSSRTNTPYSSRNNLLLFSSEEMVRCLPGELRTTAPTQSLMSLYLVDVAWSLLISRS